jgi:hypothetical protein
VADLLSKYEREIDSISTLERDIILILAAMWNNEYHLFLSSCVEANGDINLVRWSILEEFPFTLRRIIESRAIPNFCFNHTIRLIRDQSREELRKKRALEDAFLNREAAVAGGGGQLQNNKRQKQQGGKHAHKDDGSIDGGDHREEDPNQTNNNLNPDWKMSSREFRRIISPYVASCPKNGEKSVCARFFLVGKCFFGSQCHHSHDELTEGAKVDIEKWVGECRKKAKTAAGNKKKNGNNKDKNES